MRKGRILRDIVKFLKTYQNAIILSDNETANIEHYLRAKGLMDLARFYERTGIFTPSMMSEINEIFADIEHLTVLRIRDNLKS